jgi:indole-3-glycerol phosphate synthase
MNGKEQNLSRRQRSISFAAAQSAAADARCLAYHSLRTTARSSVVDIPKVAGRTRPKRSRGRLSTAISNRHIPRIEPNLTPAKSTSASFLIATNLAFLISAFSASSDARQMLGASRISSKLTPESRAASIGPAIFPSRQSLKASTPAAGDWLFSLPMETGSHSKSILDRIVDARRESVAHRKRVLPDVALKIAVEKKVAPPRDFAGALSRAGLNVIAELKKASPSRGILRHEFAPSALAASLEQAGAAALSVLTEEDFFSGSLADLKDASKVTKIPILRKDFIVDPWQVWETRAAGADSFLLIAAILSDAALSELLDLARSLHMEPLVEVHSRAELERVVASGAGIIGVNNRDLRNFEVHIETSLELIEGIPDHCVAVSESGLRTHADLDRLRSAGFDAFLVGEHLMNDAEPANALRALLQPVAGGHGVA